MPTAPSGERKEFETTTSRVSKSEANNTQVAVPNPIGNYPDGDVLQFAASLAMLGSFLSPVAAFNGRPGIALGAFLGPWTMAAYVWRTRVGSKSHLLPADAAARCKLLESPECAHCLTIPVRQLKKALAPPAAAGGNYPTLDAAALTTIIDAVLPKVQKATFVTKSGETPRSAVVSAVVSDFGAERLCRAPSMAWSASDHTNGMEEEKLWIGLSAKPPRWVGDEQAVQLCFGMPGGSMQAEYASSIVMPILARIGADDVEARPA